MRLLTSCTKYLGLVFNLLWKLHRMDGYIYIYIRVYIYIYIYIYIYYYYYYHIIIRHGFVCQ